MRRVRRWLIDHSSLYRRFVMWRWKRAMHRAQRVMGEKLMPAVQRATEAMVAFAEAWKVDPALIPQATRDETGQHVEAADSNGSDSAAQEGNS